MRAVSVGLIAVFAVVAIVVWSTRQNSDNSQANSDSTQTRSPAAASSSDNTSTTEVQAQPSVDSTAVAEQVETAPEAVTEERTDPFRVVENTGVEVTDKPQANEAGELLPDSAEVVESAVDDTDTERKIISIPAGGYPVEDSMKYYVPKHLRRPGNLGGPPPPAFMVPENADGVRSIESMLPPAPDQ